MKFLLGCNYWASNAGTEMWRCFDPIIIDKELTILEKHGIKTMRVFPVWRDFQPITPIVEGKGCIRRYSVNGNTPENAYYLDEEMLRRFDAFVDLCEKHGMKLIVGLITGWMSGGLFIPPAMYGKNVLTDPLALYFEQLFIKGFVTRFSGKKAIYAWDLGNECNCMDNVESRWQAASWTAAISNAIRAADPTRPIVSGMHGLGIDDKWTIADQGEFTDLLTTHPYPFWCEYTRIDKTLSVRTTLLPTAQTKLYSELSNRPCLAEEMGTMGPMICSDVRSADFMRINLFSLWANDAYGALWWCANDQTNLTSFPYESQMVEQELGLLRTDLTPKPVLNEFKKFSDFLSSLDFEITSPKYDAVCLLTRHQRHWGIAYMTYMLAKKAGINIKFAYADDTLPDADVYLLPSISGMSVMPKRNYQRLKELVSEGKTLYISNNDAVLSEFESLSGVRVDDRSEYSDIGYATAENGDTIAYVRNTTLSLTVTKAAVLMNDSDGNPFMTLNNYGNGKVYFVNAPIEDMLIETPNAYDTNAHLVYKQIFDNARQAPISVSEGLFCTYHTISDGEIVVILNHTGREIAPCIKLSDRFAIDRIYYGSIDKIPPYDACVIKIKSK